MRKSAKPIVWNVTDRRTLARTGCTDSIAALLQKINMAIDAGVDAVQIREKDLPGGPLLALTREAVAAPGCLRGRMYVNDRLDVAVAAGAAGVHLSGASLPLDDVVRWCREGNAGRDFRIGISCHRIEGAREAQQNGADYIFFGPIFDTPAKRRFGPPQGLERLREICRMVQVPVIAIGGVNQANAQDCIRAGASGIAAIRFFQETTDAETLKKFVASIQDTG